MVPSVTVSIAYSALDDHGGIASPECGIQVTM
jgi:hypothetical protein